MRYLLTPKEVTLADNTAIKKFGIPSAILMENAARTCSDFIKENFPIENKILVLCGSGNNGGDGYALARHLLNDFRVTVAWFGTKDKMSEETRTNFNILNNLDTKIFKIENIEDLKKIDSEYDVVVDAMLGVGGSENLRGIVAEIVAFIKNTKAIKIAIDIPTGLNSLTGKAHKDTFKADYTITMFSEKIGLSLKDGKDFSGKIIVADLNAPRNIVKEISQNFILEDKDIGHYLEKRNDFSSKFDYGRVLVIAGSKDMPGAAALSANSAIKSGAGLVELLTVNPHSSILPEVIVHNTNSSTKGTLSPNAIQQIMTNIEKYDRILIGPGITRDEDLLKIISELIDLSIQKEIDIIIDADGLGAIDSNKRYSHNLLITPHTGEMSKISGIPRLEIEKNHYDICYEYSKKLNCNIHLKFRPSLSSNGSKTFLNIFGNPGMASAGSGDVLAGIILGLPLNTDSLIHRAAIASYIHSKSGDIALKKEGYNSLTASSILNNLPETLKNLE